MSVLKFKRFTRLQLSHQIDRALLTRFLEKFQADLAPRHPGLPWPALPDAQWAEAVAGLLAVPEHLPDALCEALYAIDEMASPDGQEQLEQAMSEAGLPLAAESHCSRQDIALQAWLADPALLARIRNRQRLLRLTAFEYFGTHVPPEARTPFAPPTEALLGELTASLDPWFARHHRGRNTSRVELYRFGPGPGAVQAQAVQAQAGKPDAAALVEYWFLVRHGDTFTRASKVEEQRTGIIHFRPQRDDVVVYSPGRDELRVNARTRGERELYVRTFGAHLRGAEDYFSIRNTYTLEPLRCEGAEALGTHDIPGLSRVTLRRIEAVQEGTDQLLIREAGDLFMPAEGEEDAIPRAGRLCSAHFDLHFVGCSRPRPMQIRVPNVLKLRRHCDLHVVDRLVNRFRVSR